MKNYLLDTHILIWVAKNNSKVSKIASTALLDERAKKYISIVSAWEVAIKLGLGKLDIKGGLSEFFRIADENGVETLPLRRTHLDILVDMPMHHKDPFDRILIATALAEDMIFISADENISKYGVPVLW
jgi:PIN domain nuclease of toxin-antitoxin system